VVCAGENDGGGGWRSGGDGEGEKVGGTVFIVVAAEEELGLRAVGETTQVIVAAGGADGEAEGDESVDARVWAAGGEGHDGSEGEAGAEYGEVEFVMEPVKGCADIVLLAVAFVVGSIAAADAAEVKAQGGKAEMGEGFLRVVDGLGVHGAAAGGVRMGDESRVTGGGKACGEQGLEAAGGAVEFDRVQQGGHGAIVAAESVGYPERAWPSTPSN